MPLTRPTLFQTPDSAIFYLYNCKIKKQSTDPQQNTCIFIKLQARSCLFWRKNRKIKKNVFLPIDHFFQHVSGNTAIFMPYLSKTHIHNDGTNSTSKTSLSPLCPHPTPSSQRERERVVFRLAIPGRFLCCSSFFVRL